MKNSTVFLKNLLKGALMALVTSINVLIETIILIQPWINYRATLVLILLSFISTLYGCAIVSIKVFPLIDNFLK